MRRDVLTLDQLPPGLRALVVEGGATLPASDHREMLNEIGPSPGPVTDAGTRALEEQRGERA